MERCTKWSGSKGRDAAAISIAVGHQPGRAEICESRQAHGYVQLLSCKAYPSDERLICLGVKMPFKGTTWRQRVASARVVWRSGELAARSNARDLGREMNALECPVMWVRCLTVCCPLVDNFVAAGHWSVLVDAPAALATQHVKVHKGVSPKEHVVESAGRYV